MSAKSIAFVSPTGATPNSKQWLLEKKAFKVAQKARDRKATAELVEADKFKAIYQEAYRELLGAYKRIEVKKDIDAQYRWVASLMPRKILEILVRHGYAIDLASLTVYNTKGLCLDNPESALRDFHR